MAPQYVTYPEGTPQRELQDAVQARYPGPLVAFFDAVAAAAKITRKSAGGTYYAFLRGSRGLPDDQRAAYVSLIGVDASVLDDIDDLRERALTPPRRDRLAEVEAALNRLGPQLDRLADRVSALEQQAPPRRRKGGSSR